MYSFFFSGFLGFASIFYLFSFSFSFPFAFSIFIFPYFFKKSLDLLLVINLLLLVAVFFSFQGGCFGSQNRWRPINGPGQASGSFQELSGTELCWAVWRKCGIDEVEKEASLAARLGKLLTGRLGGKY
jgi:hypothetical protein